MANSLNLMDVFGVGRDLIDRRRARRAFKDDPDLTDQNTLAGLIKRGGNNPHVMSRIKGFNEANAFRQSQAMRKEDLADYVTPGQKLRQVEDATAIRALTPLVADESLFGGNTYGPELQRLLGLGQGGPPVAGGIPQAAGGPMPSGNIPDIASITEEAIGTPTSLEKFGKTAGEGASYAGELMMDSLNSLYDQATGGNFYAGLKDLLTGGSERSFVTPTRGAYQPPAPTAPARNIPLRGIPSRDVPARGGASIGTAQEPVADGVGSIQDLVTPTSGAPPAMPAARAAQLAAQDALAGGVVHTANAAGDALQGGVEGTLGFLADWLANRAIPANRKANIEREVETPLKELIFGPEEAAPSGQFLGPIDPDNELGFRNDPRPIREEREREMIRRWLIEGFQPRGTR